MNAGNDKPSEELLEIQAIAEKMVKSLEMKIGSIRIVAKYNFLNHFTYQDPEAEKVRKSLLERFVDEKTIDEAYESRETGRTDRTIRSLIGNLNKHTTSYSISEMDGPKAEPSSER